MRGLNNYRKRIVFCGISLLLTVAMVFCFPKSVSITEEALSSVPAASISEEISLQDISLEEEPAVVMGGAPAEDEAEARFRTIIKEAVERIESQKQMDEALLQELDSEIYTFQYPFVILDPYNMAPLSALALFTTDKPAQISIHVPGDTSAAEVDFTFDGYNTRHQIPIYGLYAERENTVELTAVYADRQEEKTVIKIDTAPLPEQISFVTYVTYIEDESKYQPGFNFLYASPPNGAMKRAVDISGDIRWFLSDTDFWTTCNYNHGNSVYLVKGNEERRAIIYELNYLGKVMNLYYGPFGAHHDIEPTPSGKMILTGGKDETVQDIIYEIDLKTGEMVNFLDYKEVLQRSRIYGVHESNVDWMHMNSVVEYEGDVIVSSNYQSTVLRNSWDGQIKWMLADHTGYYKRYEQYLLTPIGRGFEYPYNQHAVEVLPNYDKNPDTIDIMMFDNGASRNVVNLELQRQIRNNEIVEPPLYSRMVHYRIDEKNMTVEQIWQYGKERPEIYSEWYGDADLLGNGNILGCFSVMDSIDNGKKLIASQVYTEVEHNKNVVWECFATSKRANNCFNDYRIERLEIYTEACNDLKIGTPANNLIPEEVLQKYA